MRNFAITTDSNSDLLPEYIKMNNIGIISHYYDLEGKTYGEDNLLTPKEFYDRMRAGVMPTTMASNPAVINETFQAYCDQGVDILHISFSSALSGGYSNVAMGAKGICEENPDMKIIVIDTLNVSLGQGMIIMKAVQMRQEGRSIEETAEWIEKNKQDFCVLFTVDDLFHLQRGGRVSKATAIVGSLINVKPILVVNDAGELVPLMTVRGRKKSLSTIVDQMILRMGKYKKSGSVICIVHGDALEDAESVASLVRERLNTDCNIIINTVSPSIGAHSGPGALGIIFMGEYRQSH